MPITYNEAKILQLVQQNTYRDFKRGTRVAFITEQSSLSQVVEEGIVVSQGLTKYIHIKPDLEHTMHRYWFPTNLCILPEES